MNFVYKLSCFVIVSFLIIGCSSTKVYQPKKLSVKGDFAHKTKVIFPESFDNFKRADIYSFNPDSSDIGVSYKAIKTQNNIVASIYIYPAGLADESRLRNEYFSCLQQIANNSRNGINATPETIRVSKDGYKVLGLKAIINEPNYTTSLVLFECAKYFLKYRITADNIDTIELAKITTQMLDKFSPIDVVKFDPLKIGATVHMCPASATDSFGIVIATEALTKVKWIKENVDSLERVSGFPGLYFECHKEALTQMIADWDSVKHNDSKFKPYFNELLNIRNSGFLNEFIIDQFMGILLLPEGLELRMGEYDKWKRKNKPTVSLVGPLEYYFLTYDESDED